MQTFQGIEIIKIPIVNPEDTRGPVYEWCKGQSGMQVSIFKRKLGITFGNHYHLGADPSKNPEKFFLIKGKMKLKAKNLTSNEIFETIIEEGTELLIYPKIWHSFESLADVIFIEYRSTVFDKNNPDVYTE